jgi:predicted AlkP superfamily phosphohydrolase/phosphomutase
MTRQFNPPAAKGTPGLVVIALDGTDPDSIAQRVNAGWLPELARILPEARRVEVQTLADLFIPSSWPCALSGIAVQNHGIHAFRPIRSGTLDIIEGTERHVPTPFWETAVQAGLRANVLDAPICAPPPKEATLDGLRFVEWGSHPPVRGPGSYPPSLISGVIDRHGSHPCREDDLTAMTASELTSMQVRLCEGVRVRENIIMDMLDGDAPDLLVAGFSEVHTAEHQFINLTVSGHGRYDPGVATALGDAPLRSVYQAIDATIGRIVRRLPGETAVLLVCLCGMEVNHGGQYLLDDVLRKVGLTGSKPVRSSLALARQLWRLLPERFRIAGHLQAPFLLRRSGKELFWASFDWAATRAFSLPWGYDGHLRVNLRGREPHGIVEPGAERSALLDEIEAMLVELKIAGTEKAAVRRVVRAQEVFPGRAAAELPDLLVKWSSDAPIEAIESPRLGRIENRDSGPRGGHSDRGGIFAWGNGIAAGPPVAGARDIDVAPTVLSLLGIAPPAGLDGCVIGDLLSAPSSRAGAATGKG